MNLVPNPNLPRPPSYKLPAPWEDCPVVHASMRQPDNIPSQGTTHFTRALNTYPFFAFWVLDGMTYDVDVPRGGGPVAAVASGAIRQASVRYLGTLQRTDG